MVTNSERIKKDSPQSNGISACAACVIKVRAHTRALARPDLAHCFFESIVLIACACSASAAGIKSSFLY
jgi:hypothetical protein